LRHAILSLLGGYLGFMGFLLKIGDIIVDVPRTLLSFSNSELRSKAPTKLPVRAMKIIVQKKLFLFEGVKGFMSEPFFKKPSFYPEELCLNIDESVVSKISC
jgi:hypothetical protein